MRDNPPMLPRFHAPRLDADRREATLDGDEGRHLTRVLRLGVGDDVAVFDGRGAEFRARVKAIARDSVHVELMERVTAAPEPRVSLTLVQGILKGVRMDDVVRDATMMGVRAVVPVMSAHVAVKASALERGKPAERWRRVALASAKQSRRATLPEVHDPRPLSEWLGAEHAGERLLFVEPSQASGEKPRSLREWLTRSAPVSASLIVGPEGGWAAEEIEAAIATGCTPVTLGGLTLRADAMAVVAISICRFVFESDST
jgi:16S rRNA (uracil1498-N3)-methyltransferase